MNWSWILPASASTYAPAIDRLYYVILFITGTVFFITELTLVWFLIKYRHREGRKAEYLHGNMTAEVVWTVVPFVIVVGIGIASRSLWASVKDPSTFPEGGIELLVTAKQFEWNVTYPGPDGQLGTGDDFTQRNRMDVPVDEPVRITLHSEDVIHSFWVRDFRLKQDAVPGMEIPVWFQATRTGEFTIGCAELCGTGHTRMRGTLTVHDAADYQSWLAEQTRPAQ